MNRGSYVSAPNLKTGRRVVPTPNPVPSLGPESDLCNFSGHLCRREKLQGFDYCLRHILEDKNAPYKQCNFHYRSQRRCPRPAPKSDKKDGYCIEHGRSALIARQKTSSSQRPKDLTQSCLQTLEHYKSEDEPSGSSIGPHGDGPIPSNPENDMTQMLSKTLSSHVSVAPTCSDGDSNDESTMVDNTWRGDGDSDAESIDSEMENPLNHAGTYTAEEVIRIMRDKLIRLQKLYIDQFQRLRCLLKEERRSYRLSLKRELEADVMPIDSQPREDIDEIIAFQEAKAMSHYNKPQGLEAALFIEQAEKRQRLSESHQRGQVMGMSSASGSIGSPLVSSVSLNTPKAKCTFNLTSSTKCGEICVPISKFCLKHILQDTNQVLFRACGVTATSQDLSEDGPCETPVPDVFEWTTCVYHTNFLPPVFNNPSDKVIKSDVGDVIESTTNGNIQES